MDDYRRAFDLIPFQQKQFACEISVASREEIDGAPHWRRYSGTECLRQIDTYSQALMDRGVERGDVVAIIGCNSAEWLFLDMGTQQIGAILVPMFPTISDDDFSFIMTETKAKLCFVSDPMVLRRMEKLRSNLPALRELHDLQGRADPDGWQKTLSNTEPDIKAITKRRAGVSEKDIATIIFTSGTTGTPKGVMLSHRNIVSNVKAITTTMPLEPRGRALSFLPLSHSFERLVTYAYIASGVGIYYLDDLIAISPTLEEVRPHYFTTVPRLIEKMYEALESRGEALSGPMQRFFRMSLDLGTTFDERRRDYGLRDRCLLGLARRSVFARWRDGLGGYVKLMLCGGAALQPRLACLLSAAGITLIEGYGLTETTTFVTTNRIGPDGRRIGSVGLPVQGVEVRIGEGDEILVRGPNVMEGYLNRPDLTREVIDEEGWFHTGDTGRVEEDGYLYITGRLKELFKLSGGEYIAPQALERTYIQSPYIEQIMIVGDGKKYVAALIVPVFARVQEWCLEHSIEVNSRQEMVAQPDVLALFTGEIEMANQGMGKIQQVKRFALVPDEWSTESGELSPTMKMKRKVIQSRYEDLIEDCYEPRSSGPGAQNQEVNQGVVIAP
jgi:long-chain acyl-CoA synthetase